MLTVRTASPTTVSGHPSSSSACLVTSCPARLARAHSTAVALGGRRDHAAAPPQQPLGTLQPIRPERQRRPGRWLAALIAPVRGSGRPLELPREILDGR